MLDRYFIDTNLFLRYLTNDVPEKADRVEALFQSAESNEIKLVTNALVIAEIVWTLSSFYKLSKPDVRDRVLGILNLKGLDIPEADLLLQSTIDFADKNVDFIDAYNQAWATQQQVNGIYTYDRKHFSRFDGITIFEP